MNMQTKLTRDYDNGLLTWEEYNEKMKKVIARHNKVINKPKAPKGYGRTPNQTADRNRLFGKP